MTVRELRDALTEAINRPDDGQTPVGDLEVIFSLFDQGEDTTYTGPITPIPGALYQYDDGIFIINGDLDA